MTRKSKNDAELKDARRLKPSAGHFNEQAQPAFTIHEKKKARKSNSEWPRGEQFKALKSSGSDFNLLLYCTLTLQQTRMIAQTLQDKVLLNLIDLAISHIDESLNRHLYQESCGSPGGAAEDTRRE